MEAIPVLFDRKEACCGCGACLNICPKEAILMKEDEYGFFYPVIDEERCIRCGQCRKVCAFQNREETNEPIECYAAISRNTEQASKSASGGVFAAIAEKVIDDSGVVYGAAFSEKWGVHHVKVTTLKELVTIQGSKYAHSNIERNFFEAKKDLLTGRKVLFSGTPCQIAGLYGYLGRDYDNLITIDIVCHGVPSTKMLQDYLKTIEDKQGGKIINYTFRDKSLGWGINSSAVINGKKINIWQSSSSYLYFFTRGWIYRENCYKCKYTCEHRPADITLGDYWGIEKQHPNYIGKGKWDEGKGISCLIANTDKGVHIIKSVTDRIAIKPSTFEKISKGNSQLRAPCSPGNREKVLNVYAKNGWGCLEEQFQISQGLHIYLGFLKSLIPTPIKRVLKRIK